MMAAALSAALRSKPKSRARWNITAMNRTVNSLRFRLVAKNMSPFNFRRIGIDQFSETALIVTHAARRQPRCRLIEGAVYRHDETGLASEVETMKIVSLGLEDHSLRSHPP